MVGFFIWAWNSAEWLEDCIKSFRTTTDAYLLGIANAPTDGSGDMLYDLCDEWTQLTEHHSVTHCVNIGYEHLYEDGFTHIGFIHPDQRFFQFDWVDVLVKTVDTYPQIGKISCCNTRKEDLKYDSIYPGSEAANLMRASTWEKVGPWDEDYIGIGGYDDWDYQQKLVQKGFASAITPGALMWHAGMGTRTKRPESLNYQEAMYNGNIYNQKWNTWEAKYAPDNWQDLPIIR